MNWAFRNNISHPLEPSSRISRIVIRSSYLDMWEDTLLEVEDEVMSLCFGEGAGEGMDGKTHFRGLFLHSGFVLLHH